MFRMCNCGEHHTPCCKKNFVSFLAGAATFNLLAHIIYAVAGTLPINFWGFILTPEMNMIAIVLSAVIVVALFWWMSTFHCEYRGDRNREQNKHDRTRFEQQRAEQIRSEQMRSEQMRSDQNREQ